MWNPPVIEQRTMTRRSPVSEAADLLVELVSRGVRTICFMRSRRGIELINRFASMSSPSGGRARWPSGSPPTGPATRPSSAARSSRSSPRATCSPSPPPTRSSSESTSASSTPRSASTSPARSPACGRCGGGRAAAARGLAVYVAGEDALDQFFCRHPDEFLERPVEAAILDHRSEQIQMQHLLAAAYEAPLGPDDDEILGEGWRERAERLVTAGELRRGRGRALPDPHRATSSRAGSRCAPPRPTASRSSTRPRARCSATSRPSGPSPPSTPARSTCTWAAPTRSRSSTSARGARS